jgi:hypothetical protein
LIDTIENPYIQFDPKKFTPEQKKQWLEKEEEKNKEFQKNFEDNANRFKPKFEKINEKDEFEEILDGNLDPY